MKWKPNQTWEEYLVNDNLWFYACGFIPPIEEQVDFYPIWIAIQIYEGDETVYEPPEAMELGLWLVASIREARRILGDERGREAYQKHKHINLLDYITR